MLSPTGGRSELLEIDSRRLRPRDFTDIGYVSDLEISENIPRGFTLSVVQPADAGINKPFDRILKSFVDEAPSLFLRLLGMIPAGAEADIQPLRPETAPAMVLPDYVAVVRIGAGEWIVFHVEFQSNYHSGVPRDMARYGGSLAWQYQMLVCSVLLLLRPDRAPAEIPEVGEYNIGTTRTVHPFKVVRLWELDPAPILETGNPRLLPWALLMKSTDEQVRSIASIVARQGDDEAVVRFLVSGSVRYDRNTLEEMLGGRKMGLMRAILDGSKVVQERVDEVSAAARAEGQILGQAAEARKFLLLLLRKHFPELQSLPEIDAISSVTGLESIIEAVLDGCSPESIREAILAAAKPNYPA